MPFYIHKSQTIPEAISQQIQKITSILYKEAKKRQESADLYKTVNETERAAQELSEKAIIDHYLPEALSEEKISAMVDKVITELGPDEKNNRGLIIRKMIEMPSGAADGGTVARLVQERFHP